MNRFAAIWILPLLALLAAECRALSPLSSEEMTSVVAQDGISFEWDLRINSDIAGNIDTTICPAGNRVQCRLAMKFAGREDLGGEWLVLKGYSGRFYFPRFNLNAGTSPAGATAYGGDWTTRFVPSGGGAPVSPYNKPNLLLTFPEDIQIFNFRIAGMAIEYGAGTITGTTAGLPSGNGFLADPTDSRSFIGLAISNSVAGQPATVRVDGTMSIFGF